MAMTQRMDELDDMVTTTFHTFQALTLNCARCHNHKFDPIPAKDYYKLTSVFSRRHVRHSHGRAARNYRGLRSPRQADQG